MANWPITPHIEFRKTVLETALIKIYRLVRPTVSCFTAQASTHYWYYYREKYKRPTQKNTAGLRMHPAVCQRPTHQLFFYGVFITKGKYK
jgi:hypothetical protein